MKTQTNYSEYTTTVHSAPENFGDCTDEQAEKIVEKLKKMISEQFPGIQIRINPCYGGCGSMADATHNSDGDTDDTCEEIDAWISENWEKALDPIPQPNENMDTDHDEQKRSIRLSDWEPVATYGQTFPKGNETGACDVEVMVAGCGDDWYIRTRDDAGGSDECDSTPYPSLEAATEAAKEFALEHDECDGLGASDWLDREQERAVEAGKSDDGEYVLAHKDGTRWDKDRYSDIDAARAAIASWYDGVQAANPGTNIIWHLMDTPCLGQVNEDGEIEIVPDEEDA